MNVYYVFTEGKPLSKNNESKEIAGAYINCWVKSKNKSTAIDAAKEYVLSQGWQVVNIEEIFIATRERYIEEPESLECFDQAIRCGIGAIFYTWPIGSEDD